MSEQKRKTVSIQELAPLIIRSVDAGGTAELTVTGHSMDPMFIDRVSKVALRATQSPRRGDMALYRRDNGVYVLHRITVCEDDGTYTMCGDAQTALERGIRREQILAVVDSFARRNRWHSCDFLPYRCWWHLRIADRPLRLLINRVKGRVKRAVRNLFP